MRIFPHHRLLVEILAVLASSCDGTQLSTDESLNRTQRILTHAAGGKLALVLEAGKHSNAFTVDQGARERHRRKPLPRAAAAVAAVSASSDHKGNESVLLAGAVVGLREPAARPTVYSLTSNLIPGPCKLNGWCADRGERKLVCDGLYWCGQEKFVISTAVAGGILIVLFYTSVKLIYPAIHMRYLSSMKSKYEAENTARWFAWHVQSQITCSIIIYLCFWPVISMTMAGPDTQFGFPTQQSLKEHDLHAGNTIRIAQGAHIFMCYVLTDIFLGLATKLIQFDMIVHHVLFILFTFAVTYNCFMVYLAGALLLMEVSTMFLNVFSFFRNRLGYEHWLVRLSFGGFVVTFVALRLVFTPIVCIRFFFHVYRGTGDLNSVHPLQVAFIITVLVAGLCMQWLWAFQIAKKMARVMAHGNADNAGEDEGDNSQDKTDTSGSNS